MAPLVLDCSVTIAWLMPDERTPGSLALLDRVVAEGGVVPGLWAIEVGNALLMGQRRKRISLEQRMQALSILGELPISIDSHTASRAWHESLVLADRHGLTLYDATYLELALHYRLPLASYDAALQRAAESAGVEVI